MEATMPVWLTVQLILVLAAFITVIASAMGHAPLWVGVLLLCVAGLVQALPGAK
jgi:NADH:ubiquinone oxidoreductase subunit 6 (subunit J)